MHHGKRMGGGTGTGSNPVQHQDTVAKKRAFTDMLLVVVAPVVFRAAGGPYGATSTLSFRSSVALNSTEMWPAESRQDEIVGPVTGTPASAPRPYTDTAAPWASRSPTGCLSRGWMPPL